MATGPEWSLSTWNGKNSKANTTSEMWLAQLHYNLLQELFPTVVRSQGTSLTQNISNAVACIFPVVNYLGVNYISYPVIIFGAFSVIAGFSALFLPETIGTDLPQTLEDGETYGRDMSWKDVFRLFPVIPEIVIRPQVLRPRPRNRIYFKDKSAQNGQAANGLLAHVPVV